MAFLTYKEIERYGGPTEDELKSEEFPDSQKMSSLANMVSGLSINAGQLEDFGMMEESDMTDALIGTLVARMQSIVNSTLGKRIGKGDKNKDEEED